MAVPRLSPYRLRYLLVIPLSWAALLMFHPTPDPDDIYESLRDEDACGRKAGVDLRVTPFLLMLRNDVTDEVAGRRGCGWRFVTHGKWRF